MTTSILRPSTGRVRGQANGAKANGGTRANGNGNGNGRTETLYLYDVIGGGGFFDDGDDLSANTIVQWLGSLSGVSQLDVRINSPGGDVFDGFAIYNALVRFPANKAVYIDGMAWSIAGVIAMAGDTVAIASNAVFMIHDPAALLYGTADELRTTADLLDQTKDSLIDAYQRHSNAGREKLGNWMTDETWFSAQETLDNGFATSVEEALPIAACYPRGAMKFKNIPTWVERRAVLDKTRPNVDRRAARLQAMNPKFPKEAIR